MCGAPKCWSTASFETQRSTVMNKARSSTERCKVYRRHPDSACVGPTIARNSRSRSASRPGFALTLATTVNSGMPRLLSFGHCSSGLNRGLHGESGCLQTIQHGLKNQSARRIAQDRFGATLRMRHHPQNIPPAIADPCNAVERAIRIRVWNAPAVGCAVAKDNLMLGIEGGQCPLVGVIVALRVGDRKSQHLISFEPSRKWRGRVVNPHMNIFANKGQRVVPEHYARQEARLKKNLKSIADAKNEPAVFCKARHRRHDRRESRDRAGSKVVSVRKAARNHDRVE